MFDAAAQQLIEIREQQKAKEEKELDQMYEDSQQDLQRRTEMAQNDPSLNLGGVYGKI